ncbi:MAG: cytochrome b [Pseudomonadota bacterium]
MTAETTPQDAANRYPAVQRALHWSVAALVFGALALGMAMGWNGFSGLVERYGRETTNLIYQYHKTFGVMILALMLVRLAVRRRLGTPPYAEPLTDFEANASAFVQRAFYGCLIAMPILGWLGTGAGGFPVEFFAWRLPGILPKNEGLSEALFLLHEIVGWALVALIVLHVGGALKHAVVNMDRVMERMF